MRAPGELMATVTLKQGAEAGYYYVQLFADGVANQSTSVNIKFNYTSSALSFDKVSVQGSASTSSQISQINNFGTVTLSGSIYSAASAGSPFMTLRFAVSPSGFTWGRMTRCEKPTKTLRNTLIGTTRIGVIQA